MKNSNSIIGLALIGLAFGLLYFNSKQLEQNPPAAEPFLPTEASPAGEVDASSTVFEQGVESSFVPVAAEDSFENGTAPEAASNTAEQEIPTDLTLSNAFISVDFSTVGGAIKEIRFLQTKKGGPDDFVFNRGSHVTALQLSRREAGGATRLLNYPFEIVRSDAHSVLFEYDTGRGVKFVRSYRLAASNDEGPYAIDHVTTIVNASTDLPIKIGATADTELLMTLGTALPVDSDKHGEFQSFAYFDGKDDEFIKSTYFTGSKGFLGIGAKTARSSYEHRNIPVQWAAVKNQFFVSVFTPETPASSVYGRSIDVTSLVDTRENATGIIGMIAFNPGVIQPSSEWKIGGTYYVGPKEYKRLVRLGEKQDLLMQFGFFGAISKILLSLMYWIQGFAGNWGVSIILMTVIVKLVFWPLTSYSAQSSKKMQLLQEPMKELREKYADKPEKMQRETMLLFKKYGVNPLAGCLPMLVQIPIFIGLYWMLRTSSELRYESFLWIKDLSLPDTVATIGGFPLNIMPLLNGVAMLFQMRLMPMSPTADPMQQRIMRFMPVMFLFIMYGFSSGLVLYWTVQSVLSIIQTLLVYRKTENAELKPVVPVAAPATKKRPASGKAKRKP